MLRRVQQVAAHRRRPTVVTAWRERLPLLASALGVTGDEPAVNPSAVPALPAALDPTDPQHVWLALAVLSGRLPDETTVIETTRACELDGIAALWDAVARITTTESAAWDLKVVTDAVIVDVAHTISTGLSTGIQRVARETARRWIAETDAIPVSWTRDFQSIRQLTGRERERLIRGYAVEDRALKPDARVVVPWRCTYLVPELAAEVERSTRLLPIARFSGNRTGVIGFDCVPLTSAETTQIGFSRLFTTNLAAVRWMDRVAAISDAAATEYEGWRSMLAATGLAGPRIAAVTLPVDFPEPTAEELADAHGRFVLPGNPLVLVVGSHEPRKNHLAILHAAELLWRDGVGFSLTFVGGNAWGSDAFRARLTDLQRAGRPVDAVSKLPDSSLRAAYRLARCTVFPSFNEGYGLPVAESLAAGTPVVTSAFGSMADIAAAGGALTVDPHDDHAIAAAMRALITDDVLHATLARQAKQRARRTWDTYAREAWDHLTGPGDDVTDQSRLHVDEASAGA